MAPVTSNEKSPTTPAPLAHTASRLPFYYGWVIVVMAALAMVATLPGRTHGLGMITERLISDPALGLDRVTFGDINHWATLLGAAFCLPCGRLIDRYGLRVVLTGTLLCLAVVVLAMTQITGAVWLFALIMFTRGFGQSALSVVSITMVGKWFSRRLSLAMAAYAVLLSLGFIAASLWAKEYADADWRVVWSAMGWMLLFAAAPLSWLLVRNSPEQLGLRTDGDKVTEHFDSAPATGYTLAQALRTPAFWVFGFSISIYGLIASGVSLFNESILTERGFPVETYYNVLALTTAVALIAKFPIGFLAQRIGMGQLLAAALALLAISLTALPQIRTQPQVIAYAVGMGISGAAVTVLFFTIWGHAYGRAHLGRIQGTAQMLTVFASALGPKLFAECHAQTGSYAAVLYTLAGAVTLLAASAWWVPIPQPETAPQISSRLDAVPLPQET